MNKNKYYEKESRNNKSINKIDENDIYSINLYRNNSIIDRNIIIKQ